MHYFAAKGADRRQLIFLASKVYVSNSNFHSNFHQKICDNLFGKLEICVARSLFEVLCVREGDRALSTR